jgi:Family of unknown function (DUF5995)
MVFITIFYLHLQGQPYSSFKEINDVDSIARSGETSSIFGSLYCKSMQGIEIQLQKMDTASVRQIRKLELNFAGYFIRACWQIKNDDSLDNNWGAYFKSGDLSPIQLKLLGINAHINGDLWKALRDSFSENEIKDISKTVFLFHQSLLVIYKEVYQQAKTESKKIKTLNTLSLGLSEKVGKHLLVKWRKRQLKLANLYYFNTVKFERLKKKTEKKKVRIDNMIIHRLAA